MPAWAYILIAIAIVAFAFFPASTRSASSKKTPEGVIFSDETPSTRV